MFNLLSILTLNLIVVVGDGVHVKLFGLSRRGRSTGTPLRAAPGSLLLGWGDAAREAARHISLAPLKRRVNVVDVRLSMLHAHVVWMLLHESLVLLHEWLGLVLHAEAGNSAAGIRQLTGLLPLKTALALVKGLDHTFD